jgi:surface antigen
MNKILTVMLLTLALSASAISTAGQEKPKDEAATPVDGVSIVNDGATVISEQTTPAITGEITEFDSGQGAGAATGAHHVFPWGECTQFAADTYRNRTRRNITFRGNAKDWLVNAKNAGYRTSKSKSGIVTNSIIVLGAFRSSSYGHVMIVDQVRGSSILISDSNWVGYHKRSQRWITLNDLDRYNFQGVILP